ncbi:MAG: DNA internalization-related competence protein ComEC/Rec2 [Myxococcales bacterium]|nr:DNA internalization-related competence protein ComEC/Rec2 [Myxococcales bacterium]
MSRRPSPRSPSAPPPLPTLAVGVLLGDLGSPLISELPAAADWLSLAALALGMLSLAARRTAPLATLAAGLCLGAVLSTQIGPPLTGLPSRVRATVDGAPTGHEADVFVSAVAEPGEPWTPARGQLRVRFPGAAPPSGTVIVAGGTSHGFRQHAPPGAPGELWPAARAHVRAILVAKDVITVGPDPRPSPASRLVHSGLVAAMAGQPGATVPDDEKERLQRTGTWHLIAVSGAQVGVVAGATWFALRWLCKPLVLIWGRGGLKWPAAIGASAAAFAFAHAAGSPPSAVRAAILASAVAGARAIGVTIGAWEGLSLALCGTLLMDPTAVDHLGFQLSFSAIAGIILWSSRVTRWVPLDAPRPVIWIATTLGATLGATIGTLPIVAWQFQSLSPLAPINNLLVGPLLGVVATPTAVAGFGVAEWWPSAGAILLAVADTATDLALRVLAPLDVAPWHPAVGPIGAMLLGVAALNPRRLWLVVSLYTLVLGTRWPTPPEDGRLVVQFLAIGQGDSVIATFPDGRVWLIDAGPSPDVVLEVLRRQGITRLDRVILSHPHPDHFGGLDAVLANLQVANLLVPRAPRLTPLGNNESGSEIAFSQLLALASRRGTDVSFAELRPPGVLLHPLLAWQGPTADPVNDESLVFRLDHGDRRFLFTGDVEGAGEAELVLNHTAELEADVIKVPHHGSRTSSSAAFVAAVNPAIAVISCGEDNRFRHPNIEALAHYAGRRVYRTDRDGTVVISTDGTSLEVDLPDGRP